MHLKVVLRSILIANMLLTLFVSVCSGQVPTIVWKKSFGGPNADGATATVQTNDGGCITAGFTASTNGNVNGNHGGYDFWVIKLNSAGELSWQKCYGGSQYDQANAIESTKDGGYVVAGFSSSNDGQDNGNHGGFDFWIIKIDSLGNLQWQKSLGGSADERAYSIKSTPDTGYIITGYTNSNDGDVLGNHGSSDMWVIKLSSIGTIQWQKCLGGTATDQGWSISISSDNGYIITGNSSSNDGDVTESHGDADIWTVKLNRFGLVQWKHAYGGTRSEYSTSVQATQDGGYIILGGTTSNDGQVTRYFGNADCWVVKIDSIGIVEWQNNYGGSQSERATSIVTTADGGYVFVAQSQSSNENLTSNNGSDDFWIVKINKQGAIVWQRSLGGSLADDPYAVVVTTDGNYIVAGDTRSSDLDVTNNPGGLSYWIVKVKGEGVLPLKLLSFKGSQINSYNMLNWRTANESNIERFLIDRSNDGINFKRLGEVLPSSNSENFKEYSYSDKLPLTGKNFYRLRIISKDLSVDQSDVLLVENSIKLHLIIAPNPVSYGKKLILSVQSNENKRLDVQIVDMLGKIVHVSSFYVLRGANYQLIDVSRLQIASYFLLVKSDMGTQTFKIEIK